MNAGDEHSIHSPFFFDLYTKVIKVANPLPGFESVEKIRAQLLQNQSTIVYTDLGAASKHFTTDKRTIAAVAATSLAPAKMAQMLYRLAAHVNAKKIVELGTSMGITTLYLSKLDKATIYSFEGNPSMINIALTNFEYMEATNIVLIEGNINDTLPAFVENNRALDFVSMDANHQYEPTLKYFNKVVARMSPHGVIVVDDIYQSREMARAWGELRKHELVYGSIDLYRCGMLFFDSSLNKQHYTCAW
jgi:predicted O-methyltransferase YrrM